MTGNDTIAAVSTAPGEGGIGIIRISGDKAAEILGKVFKVPETGFADKTMYYGHIIEPSSEETVDEALVVFMKGPKSYTGEDVAEIQCHGGGVPLRRILDIVCGLGAVPAQPGEFTKRAFLNGRLDLAQAGAVIDLIRSKTELGYHAAKEQAEGKLSERVRAVREILLTALAEIAVRIDYPEAFEDDDLARTENISQGSLAKKCDKSRLCTNSHFEHRDPGEKLSVLAEAVLRDPEEKLPVLAEAAEGVKELLKGADAGRLVKDGVRVVIIGKPNTGKSSLFNALVREDAAIVTETPGTTRDAIEIWLDVLGVPVLLSDTAGIREDAEDIEELGIERAKEQYRKADASIFLLDSSKPLSEEDFSIAKMLDPEKKQIIAVNKTDLPTAFGRKKVTEILPFDYNEKEIIEISLIGDKGANEAVKHIEKALEKLVLSDVSSGSSLLVTKTRHKGLLEKALFEINEAVEALARDEAPEFAETNLRAAWNALGEVTGDTATDEIIDRVFEEFCVGK